MPDYEFEETWDWKYLANYFDITVPYDDVIDVKTSLHDRDLFVYERYNDDWLEKRGKLEEPLDKIGLYCQTNESDIAEDIRLHKLKSLIGKAKFDLVEEYNHTDVDEEEVCDVCRAFVEQFVEDNDMTHTEFWEKMLEIENDYVFMDALQRNIRDLWW